MVKLPTSDSFRFDRRMIERLLTSGRMKDKEVRDHLTSLVDDAGNVDKVLIWNEGDTLPSERIIRELRQHEQEARTGSHDGSRGSSIAGQVTDEMSGLVYAADDAGEDAE